MHLVYQTRYASDTTHAPVMSCGMHHTFGNNKQTVFLHVVLSELVDEGRTGVLFSDARQLADQL